MKKVLGLAVLIVAFALAAYAGPYFVIEMNPFDLSTTIDMGWDGGHVMTFAASGGYVSQWNVYGLLVTQTPSFTLGVDYSIDGRTLGLNVGTNVVFNYAGWTTYPSTIQIDAWEMSATVNVNLSSIASLWGSGVLTYTTSAPNPWVLAPTIGLECRW